jgi:hypothetical protein
MQCGEAVSEESYTPMTLSLSIHAEPSCVIVHTANAKNKDKNVILKLNKHTFHHSISHKYTVSHSVTEGLYPSATVTAI